MLSEQTLHLFELLFWTLFLCTLLLQTIFTFDDLFVDLCAIVFRVKPQELDAQLKKQILRTPQKRIGIIIANWKEDEILYQMISGNIENIQYENYVFFIGVYPNDEKTWAVAKSLESNFSQVQVIVNDRPGPTSKGQLLNHMADQISKMGQTYPHLACDLLLMQDSEDILHPLSLKVFNYYSEKADFVQIPVFSFPRLWSEFVGATYMDEFAESHTKDLLVRQKLGAAIPSCGVGTCMSQPLIARMKSIQNNQLLNENSLTEDYQLGLTSHFEGFQTLFVCLYQKTSDGKIDWIATREYFPAQIKSSIKQKTRWTLGIAFQGTMFLGWQGSFVNKYFLFRDRKGPINSFLLLLSTIYLLVFILNHMMGPAETPAFLQNDVIKSLMFLNFAHMIWRIFQRSRHVMRIYSAQEGILAILRWPLGNMINFSAGVYALQKHLHSIRTKTRPQWDKTQHQIPTSFGLSRPTPGLSQGAVKTAMESEQ